MTEVQTKPKEESKCVYCWRTLAQLYVFVQHLSKPKSCRCCHQPILAKASCYRLQKSSDRPAVCLACYHKYQINQVCS